MTVESTTTRAAFAGNGITREFPLPFPLLSASHLEVYVTQRGLADSVAVPPLSDGYSVQGMDTAEPYIVYPEDGEAPPLQAGWQLTAVRRLPLVQQTNLENGGNLHAETLEIQFDTLVMQLQQLAYDVQRSVKIPPYSANETADVSDVLRKMEKLCERAEYAARRVELQADAGIVAGGLANLAATWVVERDMAPGEVMELPLHYVPGCNVLSLSVGGVLCYPENAPEAPWGVAQSYDVPPETGGFVGADGFGEGIWQYEEVPGDGPYSRFIRILFPLSKGAVCHARVTASNMMPLSEQLLEEAAQTAERLEKLLAASGKV